MARTKAHSVHGFSFFSIFLSPTRRIQASEDSGDPVGALRARGHVRVEPGLGVSPVPFGRA